MPVLLHASQSGEPTITIRTVDMITERTGIQSLPDFPTKGRMNIMRPLNQSLGHQFLFQHMYLFFGTHVLEDPGPYGDAAFAQMGFPQQVHIGS